MAQLVLLRQMRLFRGQHNPAPIESRAEPDAISAADTIFAHKIKTEIVKRHVTAARVSRPIKHQEV